MAKPKLALIPASQGSKVFSVLPSSGVGDFDFSRSGKATRINSQGLIEEVANGQSRLEYPLIDGVVSGCPSLLLEPARTNLITYSEDFSNAAWTITGATITSNSIISPDGTLNATKLVENSSNSQHKVQETTNSITAGNVVYSQFIKKGERSKVLLELGGGGGGYAKFNLELGIVISENNLNATITEFSNNWYRCSVSFTSTGTSVYLGTYILDDTETFSYQGDGTSGVYLYGAQLEEGSYPTSYIPTNGAAVTRAAETATGAGDASTFNDSEGVLMAEISSQNDSSTKLISLASTSGSENTVWIGYVNGVYSVIRSNGVTAVETNIVPTQSNEVTKCAILYSNSNVKFYINGFNLFEDINISMPIGLDQLRFSRKGGSLPFYGKTKQLQYYNSALTDSELEILTSWVSFTEMAIAQLYTIE